MTTLSHSVKDGIAAPRDLAGGRVIQLIWKRIHYANGRHVLVYVGAAVRKMEDTELVALLRQCRDNCAVRDYQYSQMGKTPHRTATLGNG